MPLSPRRSPRAAALLLALALVALAPSRAARALQVVDFDALPAPSAVSAADLGILSVVDALVLSEAQANLLTGLPTAGWATSGAQGLLNTLAGAVVFDFSVPVFSFEIDVLSLPGDLGAPAPVVLQAFRGALPVGLDVSDVALVGDSGFHEDTLRAEAALGLDRVLLFSGVPCAGTLCFEVGGTSTFWGDTVRYDVPEPGAALLLAAGLGLLLAGAARRRAAAAAAALGVAAALAGGCVERPRILSPADQSALDPAAAAFAVEIDLGSGFGPASSFQVNLLAGIDTASPTITDVTARFAVAAGMATGELLPGDLAEGRNSLFVNVDADDDGTAENTASASFSFEPAIDAASAGRCDVLDPSQCLYPFPNDHFTREDGSSDTGRRVDLHPDSMPVNAFGVGVSPTEWNRQDGFSPGQAAQTLVPGLVLETPSGDPEVPPVQKPGSVPIWDVARSLAPDASILLIDAESGERVLLWAELDAHVPPEQGPALLIRPGVNLENGRRYIVALRNLRGADDELLAPQRAFRLYRDAIPTYVPAIEARRPHMEQLFDELAAAGVAREELYLAWDFTVASKRNLSERMLAIRDDAFARLAGAAPDFTVTEVEERPGDARIRRRVRGTFQVPLYVTNGGATGGPTAATRLYCEDDLGTPRLCEGDELPVYAGAEYSARFECVIPRSASADGGDPVTPARPSLYGHGLLGSEREVRASHVAAMAFEHNFVFCATAWIGMAEDDEFATVGFILNNFGRFPTLPDRMHQGLLNFLFLGRLMVHPMGFVDDPAFQAGAADTPVIDTSDLFYDGNSQGAIAGGALAAFAQDYTRAVLGVPGMNYSTLLLRSVDFELFLGLLTSAYPDMTVHPLLIGLAQMLWDRTEANGHAAHLTADTYPGTPAKKILLQVAFGDYQVADVTAEVMARTLGASMHRPGFDPAAYIASNPANQPRPFFQVQPYFGIPGIPAQVPAPVVPDAPGATYAFDGSAMVVWDSGNTQSPITNTMRQRPVGNPELSACALAFNEDPHECPRRQPAARVQKSHFLSTGGAVVDVCAGQACLAPTP